MSGPEEPKPDALTTRDVADLIDSMICRRITELLVKVVGVPQPKDLDISDEAFEIDRRVLADALKNLSGVQGVYKAPKPTVRKSKLP